MAPNSNNFFLILIFNISCKYCIVPYCRLFFLFHTGKKYFPSTGPWSVIMRSSNGGTIIFATDDFFAIAENLIKVEEPVWQQDVYTRFGKWMDGWETRRRRKPGHDFCIIELGALTSIEGINLDTAFFTGNHAPRISIQASTIIDESISWYSRLPEMGTEAAEEIVDKFDGLTKMWTTILEEVSLRPGYAETRHNVFSINDSTPWKFLRLNLYPDGGVARLRVFGHVVTPQQHDAITDLVSIANGGECVDFSNAHFGHPKNLIGPFRSVSMADGWETARQCNRTTILRELPGGLLNHNGTEWCILKLGVPGRIKTIVVQTYHFIGNYPDRVKVEGARDGYLDEESWILIQPYAKLAANTEQSFHITCPDIFRHIRVTILPDGGISRLRVLGEPVLKDHD